MDLLSTINDLTLKVAIDSINPVKLIVVCGFWKRMLLVWLSKLFLVWICLTFEKWRRIISQFVTRLELFSVLLRILLLLFLLLYAPDEVVIHSQIFDISRKVVAVVLSLTRRRLFFWLTLLLVALFFLVIIFYLKILLLTLNVLGHLSRLKWFQFLFDFI